jgi:hypothetical protein
MDNATALQAFERSLRRRFPDRSTPIHYVSDVRQFQRLLGHHDLRTTQRYAHVLDKTAQQQYHAAMARIEQSLTLAPVSLATLTGASPPDPPLAVSAAVTKETLDNSM